MKSPLLVGRVERAHGLRGGLRIDLDNLDSVALAEGQAIVIGQTGYEIMEARQSAPGSTVWRILVRGVETREQAEALAGQAVSIDRGRVVLAPGEHLVSDLLGFRVVDEAGVDLGVVEETFFQGAHDVLVLSSGQMIPAVTAWLIAIDGATRTITIPAYELAP